MICSVHKHFTVEHTSGITLTWNQMKKHQETVFATSDVSSAPVEFKVEFCYDSDSSISLERKINIA